MTKVNAYVEYLKVSFEEHRIAWENEHDDRSIFCVKYDNLIEAYEISETLENNTIKFALNAYARAEFSAMEEIANYFTGKTPRNGHYFGTI